jgi:hypothetical protein
MADYKIYEDNLGQYAAKERGRGHAFGRRLKPQAAAPAPTGPMTKEVEEALRKQLRGMTQKAVENICRRFRNLINAAAGQAFILHTKHKVPKGKAVRMAVRAVLRVSYDARYKSLWKGKK